MAVHPAPPASSPQRPSLTVMEGGRKPDRRTAGDEAHVEVLAAFAEVERSAEVIVQAVTGLPVPSMVAVQEAYRMAHRVRLARDEYLALTTPDDAA